MTRPDPAACIICGIVGRTNDDSGTCSECRNPTEGPGADDQSDEVYPITAKLRTDAAASIALLDQRGRSVALTMLEIVGEYEHGTTDVEDVNPTLTVEAYAAVVLDLILSMGDIAVDPHGEV